MSRTMNIFVGSLAPNTTKDELEALFGEFGAVESARVIMDRMTGQSRGFGFVQMDREEGQRAIAELNNRELNGRNIKVNEARPREEGGAPRGGGSRGGMGGGNRNGGGYNSSRRY